MIRGVLTAAFWDEAGDTMLAAVVADDDVARLIRPEELGRRLAGHFGDRVEVRGIEGRDVAGRLVIEAREVVLLHALGDDDVCIPDEQVDGD